MKRTDREIEELLKRLVASTRSPRGKYSAAESYPPLKHRLFARRRLLLSKRIGAAAAAVALLCLAIWTTIDFIQPPTLLTLSTLANRQTVALPDGTSVTLNHFSSLTYPERFKGARREVSLQGEAYFEVSKDRKHPFIVRTEEIGIEVRGTHFNVDAYANNPEVRTTLLEGSVAVYLLASSRQVVLAPNEIAIYNRENATLAHIKTENASEETGWRSGVVAFKNLPLEEIARELSNLFGVSIRLEDEALKSRRITARFLHGEALPTILSLLGESGHFRFSRDNQQIILTPKPN